VHTLHRGIRHAGALIWSCLARNEKTGLGPQRGWQQAGYSGASRDGVLSAYAYAQKPSGRLMGARRPHVIPQQSRWSKSLLADPQRAAGGQWAAP